jgi:aconitate hydratase
VRSGRLRVGGIDYRIHPLAGTAPENLPYSMRILLESLLRNGGAGVDALTGWGAARSGDPSIDVTAARIFLHDTNGVPALVDLAAMRDATEPADVRLAVPAELTIDHSVIADAFGSPEAAEINAGLEYRRNAERYRFLRWGQRTFDTLALVPPGTGIMHQINLERLARVVMVDEGTAYPDLCLGTDSHTTMVNGLGVLGWGIGGIEAEAAMLGEPTTIPVPPVVGVRLLGELPPGATATDLVLTLTERLRRHGVVGSFLEFFGPALAALPVADRATIANMSPEFGSTCAYVPIDEQTIRYLRFTGREPQHVDLIECYAKEQGLWHRPEFTADYTETIDVDLTEVSACLAGPSRPQDRIPLESARTAFRSTLDGPAAPVRLRIGEREHEVSHGTVGIAAITSCTNTSNPAVMVAAGLLARNAVRRGLTSRPWVKTTLSPGSRVVLDYLKHAGLLTYLERLGFHLAGFGCMTCIGGSGRLIEPLADAVAGADLRVAAVLSGNRNFESRINPDVRLNYLASPPLVVAYAIAGTLDVDLRRDAIGTGTGGTPVTLAEIWPDQAEIDRVVAEHLRPDMFTRAYSDVFRGDERWAAVPAPDGATFDWDPDSTYLQRPPYFDGLPGRPPPVPDIVDGRVLVHLGDSITTDHISPAGAIPADSAAGRYLAEQGVARADLNTYASRRGNHEVLMRGTFANLRLRNRLADPREGGYTCDFTSGEIVPVFDAAMSYRVHGTAQVVLAGAAYGTGSSRDWAAKGPALLGVRAVIAESYERIHRANLVGMGVLPLQFRPGSNADTIGLTGEETYTITGLADAVGGDVRVVRAGNVEFAVTVRLDTEREVRYFRHGGVLPYLLRRTGSAE